MDEHTFVMEQSPSPESVDQLGSIVESYMGEYFFGDFAECVRIDAPFQRLCCLRGETGIVSFILFTCLDGCPHITAMATRKDMRGKGYGKRLMEFFTEHVSRLGFRGIEVMAWSEKTRPECVPTQGFYRSSGFVIKREYADLWAPGMITVKMKKSW